MRNLSSIFIWILLGLAILLSRLISAKSIFEGVLTSNDTNITRMGEFHVEIAGNNVNYGILVDGKAYIGIASVQFEIIAIESIHRKIHAFDATDDFVELSNCCKSFRISDGDLAIFTSGQEILLTVVVREASGDLVAIKGILENHEE